MLRANATFEPIKTNINKNHKEVDNIYEKEEKKVCEADDYGGGVGF